MRGGIRQGALVSGDDWRVHYAFFARRDFIDAARAYAEAHGAMLVDLPLLETGLRSDAVQS